MSLPSQFSLSLELSKLLPLGALIPASSRALVRLLRDLQASGSDFLTEQDLAAVFGRSRIEQRFASTFRTAVKTSVVHRVVNIAELVIEGGAGPTVRRGLSEPAYFSTIVQLSLLTWTHELGDLAKALAKSFERRAQQGAPSEYVPVPRFDAVKGTLRACREQTSGFMWELMLSAVEAELYGHITYTDATLYRRRPVPTVLLQALMDALPALQHLPEHTLLRVKSMQGIPTIIVWAHHVLGLTVKVLTKNRGDFTFGEGPENIYIEENALDQEATLLNETKDALFHLVRPEEDNMLQPLPCHPLRGYGSRYLEMAYNDEAKLQTLVHQAVSLAIERAFFGSNDWRIFCHPSIHRIVEVSKELFPGFTEAVITAGRVGTERNALQDMVEQSSPIDRNKVEKKVSLLSSVIIALASVECLDPRVPLYEPLNEDGFYWNEGILGHAQVFNIMASLLQGRLHRSQHDSGIAALSASGWTICVSSVVAEDPGDTSSSLTLVHGVPARGGERKRLILDGFLKRNISFESQTEPPRNPYTPVAWPGDQCTLTGWTRPRKTRYFIGATDEAFEVAMVYESEPAAIRDPAFEPLTMRLGFRYMQDMSWAAFHLEACEHSAALGQVAVLPPEVVAFHGFISPKYPAGENIFVHAGLVPDDSSARWILLFMMFNDWPAVPHMRSHAGKIVCLRGRNCCFACALEQARKKRYEGGHVLLVL
ncbi:MAG: hypothetical protein L6R35_004915 [Caloplaca aegaea]|nr:MAG: hypothetical protein L6R35_004915 [Caloplaca aegaea]